MTNYEKYFGTIVDAADSLAYRNDFLKAWNRWADGDGSLICALTPPRGSGKKLRQAMVFHTFLEADVKEGA